MKHFTVEEARRTLAEVRPLAERMASCSAELGDARATLAHDERSIAGNGGLDPAAHRERRERVERLAGELERILERLGAIGVLVKDLDRGLVDFPASNPRTGETVLLCWHVGEDDLRFWHGLDEGFAGRKPLPF